jgi:hypothetical protein
MGFCEDERAINCDECYEMSFDDCSDITISAGLTPTTTYYAVLVDKFNKQYIQQVTIAGDGSFTVDSSLLPNGLLTAFSGKFEIYLSTQSDGSDTVPLNVSTTALNCVMATFTNETSEVCCDLQSFTTPGQFTCQQLNDQVNNTVRQGLQNVNPIKTGQTTSYTTGDDGDLERGNQVDFLTLTCNNSFGNTNRFTDDAGGQTYANDYVIDHLTGLGWYRVERGNFSWSDAISDANGLTLVSFSDWRVPNFQEMSSIINFEIANLLDYAPINSSQSNYWTSTTRKASTTLAYRLVKNINSFFQARTKTDNVAMYYFPCRNHV